MCEGGVPGALSPGAGFGEVLCLILGAVLIAVAPLILNPLLRQFLPDASFLFQLGTKRRGGRTKGRHPDDTQAHTIGGHVPTHTDDTQAHTHRTHPPTHMSTHPEDTQADTHRGSTCPHTQTTHKPTHTHRTHKPTHTEEAHAHTHRRHTSPHTHTGHTSPHTCPHTQRTRKPTHPEEAHAHTQTTHKPINQMTEKPPHKQRGRGGWGSGPVHILEE
jgi:hypothetical protein